MLDDNELDDAAVEIANQKYRDEFGLITPQEIRSYRDKLNLSQHDFAELLGVNPDTIVLYEVGAFPSKTDNRMIKALFAEDER
ncbi:helix-turn-helix domain-containing protein [Levilactobacillus cerevisiae]|uniref:helix-turn-helix domain-containing protein n=1 Tax=Levilactobacillus cerevisiae TaxID=1704076 RepID=UPI00345ED50F